MLEQVAAIAESNGYNLKTGFQFEQKIVSADFDDHGDGLHNNVKSATPSRPSQPPRPAPPQHAPLQQPPPRPAPVMSNVQQKPSEVKQSGLFSSLKGGAGSLLKGLRDTSSKVMATVQQ